MAEGVGKNGRRKKQPGVQARTHNWEVLPNVLLVVFDDTAMYQPKAAFLSPIRRAWNQGMLSLDVV
jgi:hypothetical protein